MLTAAFAYIVLWQASAIDEPNDRAAVTESAGCTYGKQEKTLLDTVIAISTPASSFAEAISQVGKAANLNVLADGTPKVDGQVAALKGSLKQVLDALCSKYDYSWSLAAGRTVLLNKKFENPIETPQMLPSELKRVAKDMLKIIPEVEPVWSSAVWVSMIRDLSQSLSQDQLVRLRNGEKLEFGSLGAAQRALFARAIYTRAFGPLCGFWTRLLLQFEDVASSKIARDARYEISPGARIDAVVHLVTSKGGQRIGTVLGSGDEVAK